MVAGNYEKIVEKIAQSASVEKEEVLRRIEAKRAKLSGLISQEGAAQVVAAELGVNFDNEKLKIDELLPGMRKVNTVGKIITLFPASVTSNSSPFLISNSRAHFLGKETSCVEFPICITLLFILYKPFSKY